MTKLYIVPIVTTSKEYKTGWTASLLLVLILLLYPFNGFFSRTTWLSRYHKGKTSLDLNEERDGVWGKQWHQLGHMQTICTSLQTE